MIRLAVRCRPEQAELVLAELAVLAPGGVEERRLEGGDQGEGLVEYAIYGSPGEVPDLGQLEVAIGDDLIEVESSEVADDWSERWKEFHKPVLIGGRILVRPPWYGAEQALAMAVSAPGGTASDAARQPGKAAEGELIDLVIDPGQAFGTGAHPTTRLCLEAMLRHLEEGGARGAFCDLGTGSGVLAIAAAKLGFYPVWGYDHDPAAVAAARENARVNGVEINVARVDLNVGIPPFAPFATANLIAPMLIDLAARLDPSNLPETLVCSGILPEQLDRVAEAFAAAGLGERRRDTEFAWSSLTLAR